MRQMLAVLLISSSGVLCFRISVTTCSAALDILTRGTFLSFRVDLILENCQGFSGAGEKGEDPDEKGPWPGELPDSWEEEADGRTERHSALGTPSANVCELSCSRATGPDAMT